MADDRTAPLLRRSVPVLASLDIEATCRFYAEKLGFTPGAQFPDYGIVTRDGVEIHFWLTDDAAIPKATSCRIDVAGIDRLYEEMEAAEVVHPNGALKDQPWGREFAVLDGDGNLITFGERTSEQERPLVVCICGSTRHRAAILEAIRAETLQGRIVLAPGVFSQAEGEKLEPGTVALLTALHEDKIRMADEVLVVDVDGIGEATRREIEIARSRGKPVRRWSVPPPPRFAPLDPVVALKESHRAQRLLTNDVPTLDVPVEVKELRCALVEEEASELRAAVEAGDIVEVADAVADLLYVVHGAALTFGIPVHEVFAEVHRSNMTKLGDDGQPILRADGKVLKGPNFSPPDLAPILRAHGCTELR